MSRTNLPGSLYDNPCFGECRITMGAIDEKGRCLCGKSEAVYRNWGKLSNVRKAKVVMGAWKSGGRYMPRQKLEYLSETSGISFNEVKHQWLKLRRR
jgi:hypothetical protein